MTITMSGIYQALLQEQYNPITHNLRQEEWTSQQHEQRIAYLLTNEDNLFRPINLQIESITDNLYDILLIDGHHRLIAHHYIQKKIILTNFLTRYDYELAQRILEV